MKRFFILFTILFVGGLGYGVYLSTLPQDLSKIAGRDEDDREPNPSSVPKMIRAAAENELPIIISEKQMNTWLANTLKTEQKGKLAEWVDLTGVWVRFHEEDEGFAEIILEREVKGHTLTVSRYVRLERRENEKGGMSTFVVSHSGRLFGVLGVGGRFGQARVPLGFTFFSKTAFDNLIALFSDELEWLKEITQNEDGVIRLEKGQMRIDFKKD